ncbi:conserved hypothetical protein [Histoplasma capsulatum G186AR]|uniref:Zn(2)-C6 fungal-type domain-containing protein n=1 Tax=Ajellomyces capsulatus (strain G186AR / H82 / ATCC MYA-2454 / RMSCC 2432) TaxID=447093 RepID=C0NCB4_AJECG|nr:uncharacterized protein HCBG_00760 [Histoplasma capsulatum G186AR]EEH11305.1 conserved hypothetical protein [Histoplasma capsulatum G186AR]
MEVKARKRGAHRKSRWGCTSCKRRRVKVRQIAKNQHLHRGVHWAINPPDRADSDFLQCNEQKPICTNCRIRNLQCVYPSNHTAVVEAHNATPRGRGILRHEISSASSQSQRPPITPSPSPPSSSKRASKSSAASQALVRAASPSAFSGISNPSPVTFSSTPTSNRTLELELLHRWLTRTWQCVCTSPACSFLLTNIVPRICMKTNYLLNNVFALAAIDLAKQASDPNSKSLILTKDGYRYQSAALEYSNKANAAFRQALDEVDANITPKKLSALLFFASFTFVLNLTFPNPKYQTCILETLGTSMALYVGSFVANRPNLDWLNRSSCSLAAAVKRLPVLPPELMHKLDIDTQLALARLEFLIKRMRVPVRLPEELPEDMVEVIIDGDGKSGDNIRQINNTDCHDKHSSSNSNVRVAYEIPAYKRALDQIKYSFMNDATNGMFKGMFYTILAVGGRELTAAFQGREPLALFVMMFWAVLVHRSRKSITMWWVGDIGKDIVDEISEVLVTSPLVRFDGVGETILWARREAGLDSSTDSDLSPSSLSFLVLLQSRCGGSLDRPMLPIQNRKQYTSQRNICPLEIISTGSIASNMPTPP